MEVILVPTWAQVRSSDIERTFDTWEDLRPEDGFPLGARRYYHFFVSPHETVLFSDRDES
jgi:hypothetical protein